MSIYELAILGTPTEKQRQTLRNTLGNLIEDFDLGINEGVAIRGSADFHERNIKAAGAVAYFCDESVPAVDVLDEIVASCTPIIPVVAEPVSFAVVPDTIAGVNGLKQRAEDPQMLEIATALLECVGLLRVQRRVFVSYRRIESRTAAVQLHDALSSKCFEVFLDTHDIRAGDPFQDVLWHRLCNSDVLVMLDTPGYFENKWTRQEMGRALAKGIHVLRVTWPKHKPNRMTDLAETIYLDESELEGFDGPIVEPTIEQIVLDVERLRSRSIAARFLAITGKLKSEVIKVGAVVDGVGAHRAIGISLINDTKVWAYPVVGVPSAELFNDIADKARYSHGGQVPILVYDDIGIRSRWADHLDWLNENIASVNLLKLSQAGWELAAIGED